MGDYRFYFLDRADKILRRAEFECADDGAAVAKAYELDHAHSIEIWDGKLKVATVLPGGEPA